MWCLSMSGPTGPILCYNLARNSRPVGHKICRGDRGHNVTFQGAWTKVLPRFCPAKKEDRYTCVYVELKDDIQQVRGDKWNPQLRFYLSRELRSGKVKCVKYKNNQSIFGTASCDCSPTHNYRWSQFSMLVR